MKLFSLLLFFSLLSSCSTYSVTTEVDKSSLIKKVERIGVIYRLSKDSSYTYGESIKNLEYWLKGYKEKKKIITLQDVDKKISVFSLHQDKFYQVSEKGDFLKFKTIGSIKLYLRNNEESIKKILSENNLDSLVIYEVDSAFSAELQFLDFDSMIVVIDADFNIILMDHQKDTFDINEYDKARVRKYLLDKICDRFIQRMLDIKFITE
ncbi:hypothetical protein ACFL20_08140 [Spirochaetota bacterium]